MKELFEVPRKMDDFTLLWCLHKGGACARYCRDTRAWHTMRWHLPVFSNGFKQTRLFWGPLLFVPSRHRTSIR